MNISKDELEDKIAEAPVAQLEVKESVDVGRVGKEIIIPPGA